MPHGPRASSASATAAIRVAPMSRAAPLIECVASRHSSMSLISASRSAYCQICSRKASEAPVRVRDHGRCSDADGQDRAHSPRVPTLNSHSDWLFPDPLHPWLALRNVDRFPEHRLFVIRIVTDRPKRRVNEATRYANFPSCEVLESRSQFYKTVGIFISGNSGAAARLQAAGAANSSNFVAGGGWYGGDANDQRRMQRRATRREDRGGALTGRRSPSCEVVPRHLDEACQ